MIDAVSVALTAAVSGMMGAVVSAVVSAVKLFGKKAGEHSEESRAADEAMRSGMRALLWRELKSIHEQAVDEGGMDTEQRRHLEGVYAAYHALSGNGTGTRIYEDSIAMPVLD